MLKSNQSSVATKAIDKPAKPSADFPLFPHATKRWAKKIRGKMQYFGHWDDPQGALELWEQQKDDLLAGRTPHVSATNPTTKVTKKPGAPKDFPLFAHASGRWAKKVRGKFHYFGKWDDPEAALNKWLDEKDDLLAGRTPRMKGDGLAIKDLVNGFLTAKKHKVDTGELAGRSFADYHTVCAQIVAAFGRNRLVSDLAADDFQRLRVDLAKTRGPVALGNEINRVRIVFKWGFDSALIDKPVRYGPEFRRPTKKVLRKERQAKGARMFEAADVRRIIDSAPQPLKAMVMLAINCAFGNHDCGSLPVSALDLKAGWVSFPRPKTAIPRRCWLWPETIKAIQESIAQRPDAKDSDSERLFVTKFGGPWSRFDEPIEISEDLKTVTRRDDNPIAKEMSKLLKSLKLHRPGLGFYALRHTFETIGGETRDQAAVDAIMGHAPADSDMSAVYRERIGDDRLKAVAEHVRGWLWPAEHKASRKMKAK